MQNALSTLIKSADVSSVTPKTMFNTENLNYRVRFYTYLFGVAECVGFLAALVAYNRSIWGIVPIVISLYVAAYRLNPITRVENPSLTVPYVIDLRQQYQFVATLIIGLGLGTFISMLT